MKSRFRWIEASIVFVMWVGIWVYFVKTSMWPVSIDEVLYMNTAWNRVHALFILRRYFHVYFLRGFMLLAGDPMQGTWVYWGFVTSTTMVITYYLAQYISKQFDPVRGIIAVLFMLTFPFYIPFVGIPYADYTAMFIFTVLFGFYLLAHRLEGNWRKLVLLMLGFFIYLGFRSKETTMMSVLLIAGLLFEGNDIQWKSFVYKLLYVAIGFGMAWYFMYGLDQQIMGQSGTIVDSYTISSNESVPSSKTLTEKRIDYLFGDYFWDIARNWGVRYAESLPVYLFLMGIALVRYWKKYKHSTKIVWGLPIVLFGFFVLGIVNDLSRHLITIIPVLSVLAAQAIPEFRWKSHFKRNNNDFGVVAFVIFLILYLGLSMGWNFKENLPGHLILIAIPLFLIYWKKQWNNAYYILVVFCISLYSLFSMGQLIAKKNFVIEKNTPRFSSILLLDPYYECGEGKILISEDAYKLANPWLGLDHKYYNVFYSCNYTNTDFFIVAKGELKDDILSGTYPYVMLNPDEYSAFTDSVMLEIEQSFVLLENDLSVVLVKK